MSARPYQSRDGRTILMVQTWADRREWGGPSYHITATRAPLRHCLKVYGARRHPVPQAIADKCIAAAVKAILALSPDVVGLGGMGETAGRICAALDCAQFDGEIDYWGTDVGDIGMDAEEFLGGYDVAPPY